MELGSHVIKGNAAGGVDRTDAASTNHETAALSRVPRLKAEDVDEVLMGNVLSAGYTFQYLVPLLHTIG